MAIRATRVVLFVVFPKNLTSHKLVFLFNFPRFYSLRFLTFSYQKVLNLFFYFLKNGKIWYVLDFSVCKYVCNFNSYLIIIIKKFSRFVGLTFLTNHVCKQFLSNSFLSAQCYNLQQNQVFLCVSINIHFAVLHPEGVAMKAAQPPKSKLIVRQT